MNVEATDFDSVNHLHWKVVFQDSGTEDYGKNWFVDGENGRVYHHENHGMEVYAGPRTGNHADHIVLWTKEVFQGDIKVSYDYTRLDDAEHFVNIIYLLATGVGEKPFVEDISAWSAYRNEPYMHKYFLNMHCYHISYAAFGITDTEKYIRARRYQGIPLEGTELSPDYAPDDFFQPMVKHRLTFIKKGDILYFYMENDENTKLCTWKLPDGGELTKGRIGLRQMFTRHARYKNIEISKLVPCV